MFTPRPPNPYANIGLDRMSERRGDARWVRDRLEAPEAAILPMWHSRNLIQGIGESPRVAFLRWEQVAHLAPDGGEAVFLGIRDGTPYFTIRLPDDAGDEEAPPLADHGEFVELRSVSVLMPALDGGLMAYSRGILHWHARHRFCGVCGGATGPGEAGFVRICGNSGCGAHHFPRTDPAVIMLVSKGDRALLGRKPEWVAGMYSTLAGFVEPGESLEEAVAREVMEETGVRVTNVRYHSSQPWPFPASLMLGFYADAVDEDINMNPDELEDAAWFTRTELADGGAGIATRPRSDSIARRLIDDWIKMG